jgi:DNA-binding NarL/FixJ family response regulator
MDHQNPAAATVVCVGGRVGTVRGVCARVKQSGYHAIGVITDVRPDCTLPLLTTLSPDAILVFDDLPDSSGAAFIATLQHTYPEIRILLLEDKHRSSKPVPVMTGASSTENDVIQTLSRLFQANNA